MDRQADDVTITEGTIDLLEVELRVLHAGSGTDTVVFLHGIGARADRFRSTILGCAAAGMSCLAFDFPGHGLSTKGASQVYGSQSFARVVGSALRKLGTSHATVVGTSLGGHVAALMALADPDLVDKLVLVAPMGILPIGPEACETMAAAVTDTTRAGVTAKLHRLVHDPGLVTNTWIDEEVTVNTSPGAERALSGMADYFRTGIDQDAIGDALRRERGHDLACLLAWGQEDDLVPADLAPRVLANLPDGTEFLPIRAAAHAPYLEQPEVFTVALLDFIGKNS